MLLHSLYLNKKVYEFLLLISPGGPIWINAYFDDGQSEVIIRVVDDEKYKYYIGI